MRALPVFLILVNAIDAYFKDQTPDLQWVAVNYDYFYPIRLRWGKHAEGGCGGKLRFPPSSKLVFYSILIPRPLAAGSFITSYTP